MTTEERARALIGDMPWVTEHLTDVQIDDLRHQVRACLDAAIVDWHHPPDPAMVAASLEAVRLGDYQTSAEFLEEIRSSNSGG